MNLRLVSLAEEELVDAFSWYEGQEPELGRQFIEDFDGAISRISTYPEAARVVKYMARHVTLRRFPYHIWYHIERDAIVVYAVMHQSREPFYWIDRLGS